MRWQDCWKRTSTDPHTFSPNFLKRLWKLDNGRIRLRWSDEKEQWVVERKVNSKIERVGYLQQYRRMLRNGHLVFVESDSWIQACDGYITIDCLSPRAQIEARLIENLQYFNIERWGGTKAFIEEVERQDALREKLQNKRHADKRLAMAESVYDSAIHELGEKAYVPTPKDGGNEWLHGHTAVITGDIAHFPEPIKPEATQTPQE